MQAAHDARRILAQPAAGQPLRRPGYDPVGYQDINIGFRAARNPRALLREHQSSEPEA